ncbi:hypothetical protein DFR52_101909 [Hoeflea marina]|uniref:Uncharacterized protein n=1 Tax=Hoeflea marina TaxID=274592 RepID=A0A317PTF5_9HYPH|nr:hypothetical protein DFR52_101909 [Hoeflea marina]
MAPAPFWCIPSPNGRAGPDRLPQGEFTVATTGPAAVRCCQAPNFPVTWSGAA